MISPKKLQYSEVLTVTNPVSVAAEVDVNGSYAVTTSSNNIRLAVFDGDRHITGVLNEDNELVGIITDGDIRRGLEKIDNNLLNEKAELLMSKDPKWVTSDTLALSLSLIHI